MITDLARVQESRDYVFGRTTLRPRVGAILGSGLGGVAGRVEDPVAIPYGALPHFPRPTVEGHRGELILGRIAGTPTAVLRGRVHLYEGYSPFEVGFPVRLLKALGCAVLVVTNAAGGLNPALATGDLMLIRDHIFLPGMAGANPLMGVTHSEFGPRFVDMGLAYDPDLLERARRVAAQRGIAAQEGVYVMVAGPSYETPAEMRFLRAAGADAVGMSTCPEVVVARQSGLKVLGVSVITNGALGHDHAGVDHLDVLRAAEGAAERLADLIAGVLAEMKP